jgi:hypothetical protein
MGNTLQYGPETGGTDWSIDGGFYDPNDPHTMPSAERLEQMWDRVRLYPEVPRNKFWAREILGYAFELCRPDLMADADTKQAIEQALNSDFAKAVQSADRAPLPEAGPSGDNDIDTPILLASATIMTAERRMVDDASIAKDVGDFIRTMVNIRRLEERSQA